MCGVKGAIHEQLAGVKSGEGCECIYVFVSVKSVFVWSVDLSERVHPYVCQSAALPDIDVVTTKWVFDFY